MAPDSQRTAWFVAGLILLALLATNAPRLAGGIAILIAIVLAIRLADKRLV